MPKKHTRRSVKAAIRCLIMNADDPGLEHLHLFHALQDAETERRKRDGGKALDPAELVKMLSAIQQE